MASAFHVFYCVLPLCLIQLTHPDLTLFPVKALLDIGHHGRSKLVAGQTRAIGKSGIISQFPVRGTAVHRSETYIVGYPSA